MCSSTNRYYAAILIPTIDIMKYIYRALSFSAYSLSLSRTYGNVGAIIVDKSATIFFARVFSSKLLDELYLSCCFPYMARYLYSIRASLIL